MLFNLVKKIVEVGEGENKQLYTNFYLVGSDSDIVLPISIKVFKNKKGEIVNKSDYLVASKIAEVMNNEKDNQK